MSEITIRVIRRINGDVTRVQKQLNTAFTIESMCVRNTTECNPPNAPQLRPIEDFWGMLKTIVYKHNWKADNLEQLKGRFKRSITKVDNEAVRCMMSTVKRNVRKAREQGTSACLH